MAQSSSTAVAQSGNGASIGNRTDAPPPPLIPTWVWVTVLAVAAVVGFLFWKKTKK